MLRATTTRAADVVDGSDVEEQEEHYQEEYGGVTATDLRFLYDGKGLG